MNNFFNLSNEEIIGYICDGLKLIEKGAKWAFAIMGIIFTFFPANVLETVKLFQFCSNSAKNMFIIKILVLTVLAVGHALYLHYRTSISIRGDNYTIEVKKSDLFKMNNCKKVINFDECFTTKVGPKPEDINPSSLCGQYIKKEDITDIKMQSLIESIGLKPERKKSRYKNKDRYASGKLVPNGDYLLMAFAKLNEKGLAELTTEEFWDCLKLLWKEIDKYYGDNDVCIPILGAGVTRMKDLSLTPQKLLEIIIASYKLSSYKLNGKRTLYIVFRKGDKISLNRVKATS